jgi:hypothetical protein
MAIFLKLFSGTVMTSIFRHETIRSILIFLFVGALTILAPSFQTSLAEPSQPGTGSGMASKRTARALLGIFLNDDSAFITGAATTIPLSEKVAFDGGVDYVKWGGELFSATFFRMAGGPVYAAYAGSESVIRLGGRVGVGRVSTSVTIPPLLGIGDGYKSSDTKSGLYAELRASFEKNFSGLPLGGEIQVPVYFSESVSDSTSVSAYGTLGFVF